jgi:hypothetical protein
MLCEQYDEWSIGNIDRKMNPAIQLQTGSPLLPHLSEVGSPKPIIKGFQRACAKVLVLVC